MKNSEQINTISIEDFNTKSKQKTALIYKLIIVLLIIINIFIIVFFFVFKSQITSFKQLNEQTSSSITSKEVANKIQDSDINSKLVSLYSARGFHHECLQIVKNKKEYDTIMVWINSFYPEMYLCYSSSEKTLYSYGPFDYCKYSNILVIVLETNDGNRFGGVIFTFDYNSDKSFDQRAFLFNLNTNKVFKVDKASNAYTFYKEEERLVFGEDDLVINFDFKKKESYAKFPINYGDKDNNTISDLTGRNCNFAIIGIEIITKFDYEYGDS